MPRSIRVSMGQVADLDNLARAFGFAAQGKRTRSEVQAFASCLGSELADLQCELLSGSYQPSGFASFTVHDPKQRTIDAPVFRDRVVHHALVSQIGPIFEKSAVDDSYACRVGKGPLAAVARAAEHCRRWPWYAKMDVRQFFASIDHEILRRAIARRIRGREVNALCRRILEASPLRVGEKGRGLPIGALTSQHFANLYLAPLDRFLLEEPEIRGYVRYMDDFVVWTQDRQTALRWVEGAREFVRTRLRLRIKDTWRVQRSDKGLPLCGFVVDGESLRPTLRRRRRYRQARQKWEKAFSEGWIDAATLQRCHDSAAGILAGTDSVRWRRSQLTMHPALEA